MSSNGAQSPSRVSDYIFEDIIFTSPRAALDLNVRHPGVTAQVNFFEDLNNPFISAQMILTDDTGYISKFDILGGEKVTFRIKSTKKDSKKITKIFYVASIKSIQKVDNYTDQYVLHLMEDIYYESNLKNINRSYSGKCSKIIDNIVSNDLGRTLLTSQNDKQSIKVIVPNLNPIETIQWIRNRTSTIDGMPFYLYSSLFDDNMRFSDLGTLLSQQVVNPTTPFSNASATGQSPTIFIDRRSILEHEFNNTQDLFSLIAEGLIGADYEYIDLKKNKRNKFKFDVVKDLLRPILNKSVLQKNQQNPLYSSDFTLNGKSFNELKSRSITRLGGTKAYTNASTYEETDTLADYKLSVISDAIHQILQKAPMSITVRGYDFIGADNTSVVGKQIRVVFNRQNQVDSKQQPDPRMSGDYLIFSCKHIFKNGDYYVKLNCVKLANYKA